MSRCYDSTVTKSHFYNFDFLASKKNGKLWPSIPECNPALSSGPPSSIRGQLWLYYLGNKYIAKIRMSSFMVCKSTNYASQWLLIFYIASLSLNHSSQLSRHQFVKEIEVLLDQTSWTIFSVPQSFSKSTSWLHLITASKLLELERCGCTQIEDLEK